MSSGSCGCGTSAPASVTPVAVAPVVGGLFACPGCLTGVPGYNPAFGTFGAIPPFPGYNPLTCIPGYNPAFGTFGAIPPMGPLTGYNPYIGGYPGICTGCV